MRQPEDEDPDAARFWNQVPLDDRALPAKYGPKLRWPISRSAADGPVAARGSRPVPPCAAARRSRRAVFAGTPGTPSSSSWRRREHALGGAEVLEQRAPPRRADAGELVEDRLAKPRASRRCRWKPTREPVRLVAEPLQQLQPRRVSGRARSGSRRPGTNTSSIRLASEITATRGRS